MNPQEIKLHINELVLDGWPPLAEQTLRESIANTLAELIERNPLPPEVCLSSMNLSELRSLNLSPKANASAQQLGREIGQALFDQLWRQTHSGRAVNLHQPNSAGEQGEEA